MPVPLIYKKSPLIGIDIGTHAIKLVEMHSTGRRPKVEAYGYADFAPDAIVEGIVADPDVLQQALAPLLARPAVGKIKGTRVVVSLPAGKVFIRPLELPPMDNADMESAVKFEAEQYVPVPVNDLYIDFDVMNAAGGDQGHNDVLMVAAPRAIVDSYMQFFDRAGLEVAAIETSLTAISRALAVGVKPDESVLVVDFGSKSTDLAVVKGNIRLTGTVAGGGDDLTQTLSTALGIKPDQANEIKYKFGITKSGFQDKVMTALEPKLTGLVAELKKITKYYQDRSGGKDVVSKMILSGGGASMPGLVEYLKTAMGLGIEIGDPWKNFDTGSLGAPEPLLAPMYTTAAGLALWREGL